MVEKPGLRERKKLQTRETIADTALAMFLTSGFDTVSVAEVAEAANVSKMTVFNYFPVKEDLVMHHLSNHGSRFPAIVRNRAPGLSPLGALREDFLAALAAHDPFAGLSDDPNFLAFYKMLGATPSLQLRISAQGLGQEATLTAAFTESLTDEPDDLVAHLAASQFIAVRQGLVTRNSARMLAGERAADVHPHAVDEANRAFALLTDGLRGTRLG